MQLDRPTFLIHNYTVNSAAGSAEFIFYFKICWLQILDTMATFKVLTTAAICGAAFYLLLPTTVSSPTVGIPAEPSTIGAIPQFGLGTWLSDRDKACFPSQCVESRD